MRALRQSNDTEKYDAVIVGARSAGSATAMLLARAGRRVLIVDRVHPSRDTLSTHALMRAGVLQLDRWGVLERIAAAGTPPITGTTFHYGDRAETIEHAALFAPRRTVLDTALLVTAHEAGADALFGADVSELSRDRDGVVTGVIVHTREGGTQQFRAPITIGADGRRSTVARLAEAQTLRQGRAAGAVIYGYWPSRPVPHYEWFYRTGATGGIIPTNDGQVCIWVGMPATRFADQRRRGLERLFRDELTRTAPSAAEIVAHAERTGPLRGFPGVPGFLRRASGPGWALVGDAGYFKDPLTAHGITDALRDAELLARAVQDGRPEAMAGYEHERDRLSVPLFEVTETIAAYGWDTAQVKTLLLAQSAAMKAENRALRALATPVGSRAA